jgi:hypothetical protein
MKFIWRFWLPNYGLSFEINENLFEDFEILECQIMTYYDQT